jgi:hypothetical protein
VAEEYTVILFPKFEKLPEEVKRLRTEFSLLLWEEDELQYYGYSFLKILLQLHFTMRDILFCIFHFIFTF